MNNYTKIYWLTRLDFLQGIFIAIPVIICIGFTIYFIVNHVENDERPKNKTIWTVGSIFLLCTLIAGLIPTKNDMIVIWAGGKTMDFVQSDTSLSKIPYQTTSIIAGYLDKAIQELKDKK